MYEKLETNEICSLSDQYLKEILDQENQTLMSLTRPQLETYKAEYSRYDLTKGAVSLKYFGSRHIFEPENPQFLEIEKALSDFLRDKDKSTVIVLIEGFIPRITDDINYDIRMTGERGYTTHRTHDLGVKVECIEPNRIEEVKHLLRFFKPDEIEYYYYLRAVRDFFRAGNVHGNKTFEQYSNQVLNSHKRMFGDLREYSDFDFSFDNIKRIHQSMTDTVFDEHNMLSVNPRFHQTIINEVAHECSSYRDFSHVRNIEKLLKDGYSVFVVNGADHALKQRPALETMFENV